MCQVRKILARAVIVMILCCVRVVGLWLAVHVARFSKFVRLRSSWVGAWLLLRLELRCLVRWHVITRLLLRLLLSLLAIRGLGDEVLMVFL